MRAKLIGLGLSIFCIAGFAMAAPATDGATATGPRITGAPTADLAGLIQRQGLLDPSRLTTWRSYSFGITSGAGGTTSAGMLVQHLQYQISKPLTLRADIGLLHNPLGMAGVNRVGGPQQASLVIPSLDLIYRPSESMMFSIHYSQMPGVGRYANPWSPYGFDPEW